jgi:hypothetical protein
MVLVARLPSCQVPNCQGNRATWQPGNQKQKAPRRNRRGAKSKNEFELAGYLAFFILVASDPKSIQRVANVGRERVFVKPRRASKCRSDRSIRFSVALKAGSFAALAATRR